MSIDSIILAGGESKRMGRDKAFLPLCGKPFIQIVAEKLSNYSHRLIISTNKDESLYTEYLKDIDAQIIFVKDKNPYSGPLNGIVSCLDVLSADLVFISTCDTPLLEEKLIPFFTDSIDSFQAVIPEVKGKLQFLNTLYEKSAINAAENLYKKGVRSLHRWVESINALKIDQKEVEEIDPNLYSYWSINTPEDYQRIKKLWKEKYGC
nr:molybdenum cofactor guanylyltransferase [Persephonella atlantica]